jgi:glycosyltransferase involved in cell wall biosynthesis
MAGSLSRHRLRLLSIAPHHPDLAAGDSERAAYELFQAVGADPAIEASFIGGVQHYLHPHLVKDGAAISAYAGRRDEYLLGVERFDPFWQSNGGRWPGFWGETIRFLRALRPEVVLFAGTSDLGAEMLRAARTACPEARIIVTVDDLAPICAADGRTGRARGQGLCEDASPARAALGFPDRKPAEMSLRTRWLKAHLAAADRFVATSAFLRERIVAWGLPESAVSVIRPALPPLPAPIGAASPARNRFGLFGPLSDERGLGIALDAVAILLERGLTGFELIVQGDLRPASEALQRRLRETAGRQRQVRAPLPEAPDQRHARVGEVDWVLMPSLWWESAPRGLEVAFQAGRPVICSDKGGLAERVQDGVNGLHAAPGDPHALAAAMARCLVEPALWDRLAAGIPPVPTQQEQAASYRALWSSIRTVPERTRARAAAAQ